MSDKAHAYLVRGFVNAMMTGMTAATTFSTQRYQLTSTRAAVSFGEREGNYRVEAFPTTYKNETYFNLVARLLAGKYRKTDYGHYQKFFRDNLAGKGIMVLGGQTNSGKSTSCVAGMYELHAENPGKRFYSVENPIENPLPFATQLEVRLLDNKDNSLDFSDFSKGLMRGD